MLRTLRWAAAAALLSGCAVLNTASMSPACRDQYNACLDGCPQPRASPPGYTNQDIDMVTPSCVESCNRNAHGCT
jgi:hypothetical protein